MDYTHTVTSSQRDHIDAVVEGHPDARNARRFHCYLLKKTSYSRAYYQASDLDEHVSLPDVGVSFTEFRDASGYRGSVAGAHGATGIYETLPVEKTHTHISPDSDLAKYDGPKVAEYQIDEDWYLEHLKLGLQTTSKTRYKAHTPDKQKTSPARAVASSVSTATDTQKRWIRAAEGYHTYDSGGLDDLRDRVLERLEHKLSKDQVAQMAHIILSIQSLQEQTTEAGLRVTYKADAHGRIYTRSLIQGLPSAVKDQIFDDTVTYDWASCHKDLSVILSEMLGVALPEEIDKDDLDVDRKMAKIAAHGVRYGGKIPSTVDQMDSGARVSSKSIAHALDRMGATQEDLDVLREAYGGLESAMQELAQKAQEAVDDGWLTHPMSCEYDDQNVLAYILQGMEALLTSILCTRLEVALADHDGIEYVSGDVDAAVRHARRRLREWAGLEELPVTPRLVEKPLAKQKDYAKLDALLAILSQDETREPEADDQQAETKPTRKRSRRRTEGVQRSRYKGAAKRRQRRRKERESHEPDDYVESATIHLAQIENTQPRQWVINAALLSDGGHYAQCYLYQLTGDDVSAAEVNDKLAGAGFTYKLGRTKKMGDGYRRAPGTLKDLKHITDYTRPSRLHVIKEALRQTTPSRLMRAAEAEARETVYA